MNTLTEYKRPAIRYGKRLAADSAWHGLGGWNLREGGDYSRVYVMRGSRRPVARRAVIRRTAGLWRWWVEEFDVRTRAVRRTVARGTAGHLLADMALGFADLAAKTAD